MKKITQELFEQRVFDNFGDKLDITGFKYTHYTCRGLVRCPTHGQYEVSAQNLLKGFGCVKCYHESRIGKFKDNVESFISKARQTHGDTYDYSQVVYKGAKRKVRIVCNKHGPFDQEAWVHTSGQGCPSCGDIAIGDKCRLTQAEFIDRALSVHGDKYDLSNVSYRSLKEKIEVICRIHGAFYPTASNFIGNKSGCPKCSRILVGQKSRRTLASYIEEGMKVHENKFSYGGIEYINNAAYLTVICPVHGEFKQLAQSHITGVGCVKCSRPVFDKNTFMSAANLVHGNKYDYSNSEYIRSLDKVEIVCPIHGPFMQAPNYHINTGQGCPQCGGTGPSKGQVEVFDFINQYVPAISEYRFDESKRRLDIFIPSLRIAVEYHGLIWHSTAFTLDPLRDSKKHKLAEEAGIRVIHIYQDEWDGKRDIVERTLLSAMGKLPRIHARSTEVAIVDTMAASTFFNANHLQGASQPQCSIGLFSGSNMVACMSFGMARSIRRNTDKELWELQRYASTYTIVGGAGRILNHFIKLNLCHTLISYSDTRLFKGSMYEKLGFTLEHETNPDYCYVSRNPKVGRVHKSKFQRKHLPNKLNNFDPEKTEVQNCYDNGWYQLFDCGKKKWSLKCR